MPEVKENESNVPAVSADVLNKMRELLGSSTSAGTVERLPQLKINPKKKDKQNRRVSEGHFFCTRYRESE